MQPLLTKRILVRSVSVLARSLSDTVSSLNDRAAKKIPEPAAEIDKTYDLSLSPSAFARLWNSCIFCCLFISPIPTLS